MSTHGTTTIGHGNRICPFEEGGFPATYALGALDGEELRRFEEHLPGCPVCPVALREFRATVAQLPLALDPDEPPPPALRGRLLDAIAREEDVAPALAPDPTPIPFPRQRRLPASYAAAAVLLLALGLGLLGWNLALQREVRQAQAERDAARQALATTRWQLAAASAGQQISGEVVYLPARQQAVVVVNGLPPLASGQVYQIWLIREGAAPQPETVFLTGATAVQANLAQYQTLAITIEPGPTGSAAPTSPVLAASDLQ
jgi:anti-sigma-K factor RskA